MLTIPPETLTSFVALLKKRAVPPIQHNFYKKWLRFYLDFCAKYRLPDSSSKSLSRFLAKLREKKQTDEQIKQAAHAISVYLDLKQLSKTTASSPAVSVLPAVEKATHRFRPLSTISGMPSSVVPSNPAAADAKTQRGQVSTACCPKPP